MTLLHVVVRLANNSLKKIGIPLPEAVRLLLDSGVDVNDCNEEGFTALNLLINKVQIM